MKAAIIGYGDLGKYLKGVLLEKNTYREEDILYFDDRCHLEGLKNGYEFDSYTGGQYQDLDFYVCLGYQHLKRKSSIISTLVRLGRKVPSVVHDSAYVHPSSSLGDGVFIYPGVNIDCRTKIGAGSWIANGTTIAHDCTVGEACWFGASVTLCGRVSVGDHVFFGSGSTVANDLSVGFEAIVGMSSSVSTDVASFTSVVGNPLRVLNKPIKLT